MNNSALKSILKSRALASSPPPDLKSQPVLSEGRVNPGSKAATKQPVRVCLCAPTQHVGSFRCRFHRKSMSPMATVPSSRMHQGVVERSRMSAITRPATELGSQTYGNAERENMSGGPLRFVQHAAGTVEATGARAVATATGVEQGVSGRTSSLLDAVAVGAPAARRAGGRADGGSTVLEIREAETLSSIAERIGSSPVILKEANRLKSERLRPGQRLWVPKTYIFQKGDSLFKVALCHGTTVGELLKANCIPKPEPIYPGDILILP